MESNYTKLYSGNFITVRLLVARLRDVDIEPITKDDLQLGLSAMLVDNYDGIMDLYVHKDEVDVALPIVKSVLAKMDE
jgi:hypothetical protein